MDLTTLERLPLWIGGRAVAAQTTRYGEVTNPATGEVDPPRAARQRRRRRRRGRARPPRRCRHGARRRRCAARGS